jgi:hypothetical protein
MELFTVQLKYNPVHIREIYFNRKNRHWLHADHTRMPLRITAVLAVITLVLFLISITQLYLRWLVPLSLLFFGLSFSYLIYKLAQHTGWKKSIEKYIEHILKYSVVKASFSDRGLTMQFDDDCFIENWNNISSAFIRSDHVALTNKAGETYLFPSQSMRTEEFATIRKIILASIKDAVQEEPLMQVAAI